MFQAYFGFAVPPTQVDPVTDLLTRHGAKVVATGKSTSDNVYLVCEVSQHNPGDTQYTATAKAYDVQDAVLRDQRGAFAESGVYLTADEVVEKLLERYGVECTSMSPNPSPTMAEAESHGKEAEWTSGTADVVGDAVGEDPLLPAEDVAVAEPDPTLYDLEPLIRINLAQHSASVIRSERGRTVIAQGRFLAASDGVAATISVVAVTGHPAVRDKPYSTHVACYTPEGWYAVGGNYDLTWEEAIARIGG